MICLPTKVIYSDNPSLMDHIRFWQLCYLMALLTLYPTLLGSPTCQVKKKKKTTLGFLGIFPPPFGCVH